MKMSKRILSSILAIVMVLSMCTVGFTANAAESTSGASKLETIDKETPIARPSVQFSCTDVTRVAKEAYSTEPGNQIVKATPSGVPELNHAYASQAYAGETPVATRVTFTTPTVGISITGFSCSNTTVVMTDMAYEAPGTYYVDIISGTADAGTSLIFTVDYKWTDGNTYQEKCVSYVESIVTGGAYAEAQAKFLPLSGTNSYYYTYASAMTRLLGKGVYYEQGTDFTTSDADPLMTYGTYTFDTSGLYLTNVAEGYNTSIYSDDKTNQIAAASGDTYFETFASNTFQAHVYVDASSATSLSDINLRLNATVGSLSDRNNDDPYTAVSDAYVMSGAMTTAPSAYANDTAAASLLGYTIPEKADYGVKQSDKDQTYLTVTGKATEYQTIMTNQFTGKVADLVDNSSYTIFNRYYAYHYANNGRFQKGNMTAAIYVPTAITFHVVDKGALREMIDYVMNSDPDTPSTRSAKKGVNPQAWYYRSGFTQFQTAYVEALRVLNNPKATQDNINAVTTSLKTTYNSLTLKAADYTKVNDLLDIADEILENSECYDADDIALLEQAVDEVESSYSILFQPAVDTMASNLEIAVDIEPNDGDYSKVDELIALFETYNQSRYTADSWQEVEDEIAKVDRSLSSLPDDQKIIDGYATAIETAMNALETVKADFDLLEETLAKAKTIDRSLYINGVLLVDAIAKAQTAVDSNAAEAWDKDRQSEVDQIEANLSSVINGLVYKAADKDALYAAITKEIPGVEEYYNQTLLAEYKKLVEDGWAMYNNADLNITNNLEIEVKTSQITSKYEELMASYNPSVKLADKEELKAAVKAEIPGEESFYDQTLLEEYKALVAEGQAMIDDTTLTEDDQTAVNEKTAEIKAKYEELMASYRDPGAADKDALKAALDKAAEKVLDNYVDDDAKAELALAVAEGTALYEDDTLTGDDNETISASAQRIEEALTKLTLKAADLSALNAAAEKVAALGAETLEVVTYVDGALGAEDKAKYDVSAIEDKIAAFNTDGLTIEDNEAIAAFAAEIEADIAALTALSYDEYLNAAIAEYNADEEALYTADTWAEYKAAYDAATALTDAAQADINAALTNLVNAKEALAIAAYFEAKEGTTTIIDKENGFIYGLEEGIEDLEAFVSYGGGVIEYIPTALGYGTGTVVNFVVNGEIRETYTIVIFGDVNGDGVVDTTDYAVLSFVVNGEMEFAEGSAMLMAGDLFADGVIDTMDLIPHSSYTNGETEISQTGQI